jgi:hypothetical protein
MLYLQGLEKILSGIANDDAKEIESGAQMLLTLIGDVSVIGIERKLAAHLTSRAADFAAYVEQCAYDEPCEQCIHPICANYGRQNR